MALVCGTDTQRLLLAFSAAGGWQKRTLTWSLHRYYNTLKVAKELQKEAIRSAFAQWAAVAQIDFTELEDGKQADLILGFYPPVHRDVCNSDFGDFHLAHAFIPMPPDDDFALEGDIHFNERFEYIAGPREWQNPEWRTDIDKVALHEIGHALGLGHSDKSTSIMWPAISTVNTLDPDDVAGIQKIYGARSNKPTGDGMHAIDHSFSRITQSVFELFKRDGYGLSIQGVWHPGRNSVAYANLRDAHAAGLKVAAYLAVNNSFSGVQHVDNARAVIGDMWDKLEFVAVDVELPAITRTVIDHAIRRVRELGQRPILYTAHWFWHGTLGNPQWFPDVPLWNAHYDNNPDFDFRAAPYGGWVSPVGEQYTNTLNIYGVDICKDNFDPAFIEGDDDMPQFTEQEAEDIRWFLKNVVHDGREYPDWNQMWVRDGELNEAIKNRAAIGHTHPEYAPADHKHDGLETAGPHDHGDHTHDVKIGVGTSVSKQKPV